LFSNSKITFVILSFVLRHPQLHLQCNYFANFNKTAVPRPSGLIGTLGCLN